MADQESLQALQELEQHIQHLIDLLGQADRDLQQIKISNDAFKEKHHENPAQAGPISDAINGVETKLQEMSVYHNTLLAQIVEAKSAAENRSDADPGQ